MDAVDLLIGELREEGSHDSHGRFTLDRDKAREKMRRYQLAAPQAYVTELVQAAVLKGATRVHFHIDADDTRMSFDGEPFTAEELDRLFTSVFSSDKDAGVGAVRLLALGINGALGLKPRWVRLTSVGSDPDNGALLELRPGRADRMERWRGEDPGTWIHVKKRFKPGLILDFFRNLGAGASEERWIRQRCAYCPIEVVIEGVLVSHGLTLPDAVATVSIDGDGITGVAGFEPDWARSELHILTNGVRVTTQQLEGFGLKLVAVAEASDLKKNVAQSGIVRDDAYDRLMMAVLEARERAIAELCRLLLADGRAGALSGDQIRQALRLEMQQFTSLDPLRSGDAGSYPRVMTTIGLWPSAADSGALLSLDDLMRFHDEDGEVRYARRGFAGFEMEEELGRIVVLGSTPLRESFEVLFGDALKDVTRRLVNNVKRQQNRKMWMARAQAPTLGRREYLARVEIDADGVRGEVGLARLDRSATVIRFIKAGHLLFRDEKELPVPGCDMVLEADFKPYKNFNGVCKDATLAAALLAVVRLLPRLIDEAAARLARSRRPVSSPAERAAVVQLLDLVSDPEHPVRYLREYGFGATTARRYVASAVEKEPIRVTDLGPSATSMLLHLPCFATVAGGTLCLAELHARVTSDDHIVYVDAGLVLDGGEEAAVLVLDGGEQQLLRRLLGPGRLRDASEAFEQQQLRAAFLERPTEAVRLGGDLLCRVPLRGSGIEGELGLLDPRQVAWGKGDASPPWGAVRLRLLRERRLLALRDVPAPFGPAWAVVNCDGLQATDDWQDVHETEALGSVRDALLLALPQLLECLAATLPRLVEQDGDAVRAPLVRAALKCARAVAAGGLERDHAAVMRVWQLPLLDTLAGGWASLADAEAARQQVGRIDMVTPGAAASLRAAPDRFVVVCDRADRRLLEVACGADSLHNCKEDLTQQARRQELREQPPMVEIALGGGEAIVAVPIGEEGMCGEVGLSRLGPHSVPVVQLCVQHRRVATVQVQAQLALVAIINDDRLRLINEEPFVADDEALQRVIGAVQRRQRELAERLANTWDGLAAPLQNAAWRHVLDLVARAADGELDLAAIGEGLDRWSALPGFLGADGNAYTLADLRRSAAQTGAVRVIPWPDPGPLRSADELVVVLGEPDRLLLERLVPKVIDFQRQWSELQTGRRNRAMAGRVPEVSDEAVLERAPITRGGLEGFLYLPLSRRQSPRVVFSCDGVVVEQRVMRDLLPCAGVVAVPEQAVRPTWDAVHLRSRQLEGLERACGQLYEALVERLHEDGERAHEARFYLRDAVLRLYRWMTSGRRHEAWWTGLFDRLADLPLLQAEGGWMSLRQALRDRPPGLRHLLPWQRSPVEQDEDTVRDGIVGERSVSGPRTDGQASASREERMLEALRTELGGVREYDRPLFDQLDLERLHLAEGDPELVASLSEQGVGLHEGNPLVRGVAERFEHDPVAVTFLAAAVYSVLNQALVEVTDDDERAFQRLLAERLRQRLQMVQAVIAGEEP